MEVRKFQNSRDSELKDFEKQYSDLKSKYTSSLSTAIKEADPKKQNTLIQGVLVTNAEMVGHVSKMVSIIGKGPNMLDQKTVNDLTNDLIKYQKEFSDITESKNKLDTLREVQNSTSANLSSAEWMYNFYLFGLIALIFFVIYLVYSTPSQNIFSTAIASVQAPMAT